MNIDKIVLYNTKETRRRHYRLREPSKQIVNLNKLNNKTLKYYLHTANGFFDYEICYTIHQHNLKYKRDF